MINYTVKRGDCLWTIAENKLGNGLRWTEIADLNGIPRNKTTIQPGQVLKIDDGKSPPVTKPNTTSTPVIAFFGLQAGTTGSVFATWTWDKEHTENYNTIWYYDTGNSVWFIGNDSNEKDKQSVYSAPSNALRVKFKVKPISEKKKDTNDTETTYWTAGWSTEKIYDFSDNPPLTPPVPTVEIDQFKLKAEIDNLDVNATSIQFQILRDNTSIFNTGTATIVNNHASYSCTVSAGGEYKVSCRSVKGNVYSDWSNYSGNTATIPSAPTEIITCRANSETSVYLAWSVVPNATSYDIEYATKMDYFDGSNQTTTTTGIEFTHYELTGLETGENYFFRVRAVNSIGHSGWTGLKTTVIGKKPSAPTTWSSTTTAITGEALNLYWVHNAEDGSKQTYAEVELVVNGVGTVYTIRNDNTDEDEENKTSVYPIDTSPYTEGTKIQWRIRTAGITKVYGDWSVQRTIDIYAPPTLSLNVKDQDGSQFEQLRHFPFYISALAGPKTQNPIGYHLVIVSNEIYETVDNVGNVKMVNRGEEVYSKYFDISSALLVEFSANNVDLENNISYTVRCSVTMNTGLTTEATSIFTVGWSDIEYEPNAEVGIDRDTLVSYIRPYCEDEHSNLIPNLSLSVYRREFDGSFTEIATGIENTDNTFITDPHPALDYARYRIIATDNATGAVSYYDMPGFPVREKSVIIQWDDEWTKFEATEDDELEKPPWAGSMLKLPYNIDVSDSNTSDVSLIEYIGRKRPVSYYGTQLGESSTWNMVIDKKDKDTLYALRRLAIWMGDVYVREPSGSGYWANIKVSFSQKHLDLTIPVTLSIVRVEGGK